MLHKTIHINIQIFIEKNKACKILISTAFPTIITNNVHISISNCKLRQQSIQNKFSQNEVRIKFKILKESQVKVKNHNKLKAAFIPITKNKQIF